MEEVLVVEELVVEELVVEELVLLIGLLEPVELVEEEVELLEPV